jgi:putative membrane protein
MFGRFVAAAAAVVLVTGLAAAQAPAPQTPALAPTLNDAEIAHVAYTASQIDIDAAKLALSKSSDAMVKAFANDMVRDHTAVNDQALALVKKLNVTPQDNDVSKALVKAAADKSNQLSLLSGAAFDTAYVANEVAYHKSVNDALQTILIPGAKNAELKALLETGLKIFQGHQAHAEMLAKTVK